MEVDVVACAEQLPERNIEKTEMDENISQVQSFIHQFDRKHFIIKYHHFLSLLKSFPMST